AREPGLLTATHEELSYLWSDKCRSCLSIDVPGKVLHRFEPLTGTHHSVGTDYWISIIIPLKDDRKKFLISSGRNLSIMEWDSNANLKPEILNTLATVEEEKPDNNFNDGKVDDYGRIWIGTMGPILNEGVIPPGRASLYSFGGKHKQDLRRHISGVSVSNGIAWSSNNRSMYYIDSPTCTIEVFDFDLENGNISNRRDLYNLNKDNLKGVPDGMTIDTNGNLWVATYGGGKVLHIDPNAPGGGSLLSTVTIPSSQVTSVAFGGPDFTDLYVTSSSKNLSSEEMKALPESGSTFCIKGLGVKGLPGNAYEWSS
ncbi:regucalcin-like, partial [Hetaerina americana]|uniref:regucalcin-like n=1 Tax=Hetaerina americana TaxID=62018 RepID=UPI003A7F1797